MIYKALLSFAGIVTMRKGETRDINDESLARGLVKAGYIEAIGSQTAKPDAEAKTEVKATKVDTETGKTKAKPRKSTKKGGV